MYGLLRTLGMVLTVSWAIYSKCLSPPLFAFLHEAFSLKARHISGNGLIVPISCMSLAVSQFRVIEGPGFCSLRRQVLQRDLVNRVNRCLMGRSSLWSISQLRHQMFYPYVTISAAQAHESDDLRHAMLPFFLFLSSFLGTQRNLGLFEATKDSSRASSKNRERKAAFGGAFRLGFAQASGLQMQPPRDAGPDLRHSTRLSVLLSWCRAHLTNLSLTAGVLLLGELRWRGRPQEF